MTFASRKDGAYRCSVSVRQRDGQPSTRRAQADAAPVKTRRGRKANLATPSGVADATQLIDNVHNQFVLGRCPCQWAGQGAGGGDTDKNRHAPTPLSCDRALKRP